MYKVEEYIAECLESILSQDCAGHIIEVIAVDDGSPDNSGIIAQEYSARDKRLRVIRQENLGPGGARNTGLDNARGKYIVFVDADDYLAPGAIKRVIEKIESSHAQAIQLCGADIYDDGPHKLFSAARWADGNHTGMEILRATDFHVVVMYTVYLRSFIEEHQLRFLPHIYHEDNEFTPRVFYYLKEVTSIDEVLYYKRVNYDSITRRVNPKKNYDLIEVSRKLLEFAESIENETDRSFFSRLASNAFKMALTNETRLMERETKRDFNKELKRNSDLLRAFWGSDRFISKIEGIFLTLFKGNMTGVNNHIFQNKIIRRITGTR